MKRSKNLPNPKFGPASVITMAGVIAILLLMRMVDMGVFGGRGRGVAAYDPAPGFELTNQLGRVFRADDLKGKVWVGNFVFTRCAGPCPIMSAQMKRFHDEFPGLTAVSFSTDPDYDTPQVLRKYADGFGADPDRWIFLTGSRDKINEVLEGLHLPKVTAPMDHATRFFLVDRQGIVRGYYDYGDPDDLNRIRRDVGRFL